MTITLPIHEQSFKSIFHEIDKNTEAHPEQKHNYMIINEFSDQSMGNPYVKVYVMHNPHAGKYCVKSTTGLREYQNIFKVGEK